MIIKKKKILWRSILSSQTVQTLMKCRLLGHFIWVFTVCHSTHKKNRGFRLTQRAQDQTSGVWLVDRNDPDFDSQQQEHDHFLLWFILNAAFNVIYYKGSLFTAQLRGIIMIYLTLIQITIKEIIFSTIQPWQNIIGKSNCRCYGWSDNHFHEKWSQF